MGYNKLQLSRHFLMASIPLNLFSFFFFLMIGQPPGSTLFPSPPLSRSLRGGGCPRQAGPRPGAGAGDRRGVAPPMTRREVLAWLAARRPVPPDALRAGIEAVVSDAELSPLDPLPDQLALLGRQMLGRVAGRPGGRRQPAGA